MSKRKNKKKNPKQNRKQRQLAAKYSVGTPVRMKKGTVDDDYPDIPLGGWAGTVREIDWSSQQPAVYLVDWNQNTLENIPPVFLARCERDDIDCDGMWVSEGNLELDVGPAIMEQPTHIITAPLDSANEEDRIRMIFGLTSDDPIPPTNEENLRKYHGHLTANLTFPFKATNFEEAGFTQHAGNTLEVTRLLDADEGDCEEGLLVEVIEDGELGELPLSEIEVVRDGKNKQLVEDYGCWFCNWEDDLDDPDDAADFAAVVSLRTELANLPPDMLPPESRDFLKQFPIDDKGFPQGLSPEIVAETPSRKSALALVAKGLGGMTLCGITQGSLLLTRESGLLAMTIGGSIGGLIGLMTGIKAGRLFGAMTQGSLVLVFGGLIGTVLGAVTGATIGVLIVAFLGTLLGAIAGVLLGKTLNYCGLKRITPAIGAPVGAFAGAVALAFYTDQNAALTGALHGAWIGAATGIGLFLLLGVIVVMISGKSMKFDGLQG